MSLVIDKETEKSEPKVDSAFPPEWDIKGKIPNGRLKHLDRAPVPTQAMIDKAFPPAKGDIAADSIEEEEEVVEERQEMDAKEDAVSQAKNTELHEEFEDEAKGGEMQVKLEDYRKKRKEKRHALMLYSHKEMRKLFQEHYEIPDLNAPLEADKVNGIMLDIFDDVLLFSNLLAAEKKGRWADAWECGVGVVFGILVLIGSIFLAMDASHEFPFKCTTTTSASDNTKKTTTCDKEKNMIGKTGMYETGAWIVAIGSLGFILVILWRVVVKIRQAWKHHETLYQLAHDVATDGSTDKVERLGKTRLSELLQKMDKHADKRKTKKVEHDEDEEEIPDENNDAPEKMKAKGSLSMYRRVPAYYAPRSAYQRAAGGYYI